MTPPLETASPNRRGSSSDLPVGQSPCSTLLVMRRANRPIALVLLLMAVLCSPAGVCAIDGIAATVQAATPAHAHACCKSGDGTFLAASDGSCCSEPRTGFVNVVRFALQKQVVHPSLIVAVDWSPRTFVTDADGFGRSAPLVLRI